LPWRFAPNQQLHLGGAGWPPPKRGSEPPPVLLILSSSRRSLHPWGAFRHRQRRRRLILSGPFIWLSWFISFVLALVDVWAAPSCSRIFRKMLPENTAKPVFLALLGLVTLTVLLGHLNARTLRVRTLELMIPKKVGPLRELTLVLASDIHLGRIIHNQRLEDIVALINRQNPPGPPAGRSTDETFHFYPNE
jgi:hypothetical protein